MPSCATSARQAEKVDDVACARDSSLHHCEGCEYQARGVREWSHAPEEGAEIVLMVGKRIPGNLSHDFCVPVAMLRQRLHDKEDRQVSKRSGMKRAWMSATRERRSLPPHRALPMSKRVLRNSYRL